MWEDLPDEELVRRTFNFSQGARGDSAQDLSPELTRRLLDTIRTLNQSIVNLDKSTTHYSRILIWLTVVLTILTFLMLGAVGIQIYFAVITN